MKFFIVFALLFACSDVQKEAFENRFAEFDEEIKSVFFRAGSSYYFSNSVFIEKTRAGGAILKYDIHNNSDYERLYAVELSRDEWTDFIKDLYRVRTYEWQEDLPDFAEETVKEKKAGDKTALARWLRKKYNAVKNLLFPPQEEWALHISYYDSYKNRGYSNKKPANWNELKMVMDKVSAKAVALKEKSDSEVRAEYYKLFGEPISDFELLARGIKLSTEEDYMVKIYRTPSGAVARYETKTLEMETSEWLGFIRAFYKLTGEWKSNRIIKWWYGYRWHVRLFTLDEHTFSIEENPPNMREFKSAEEFANYNFNEDADVSYGASIYPSNYDEYCALVNDLVGKISLQRGVQMRR